MVDEFDGWPSALVVDTIRPMPAVLTDVLDRIGAAHVPPATPGADGPVT